MPATRADVLRPGGRAPLGRIRAGAHRRRAIRTRVRATSSRSPARSRAATRTSPTCRPGPGQPAACPRSGALLAPFVITTERCEPARREGAGREADPRDAAASRWSGSRSCPTSRAGCSRTGRSTSLAAFSGLRIRIVDNAADAPRISPHSAQARRGPGLPQAARARSSADTSMRSSRRRPPSSQRLLHIRAPPLRATRSSRSSRRIVVSRRRLGCALRRHSGRPSATRPPRRSPRAGRQIAAEERNGARLALPGERRMSSASAAELREFVAAAQPALTALTSEVATYEHARALQRVPGTGRGRSAGRPAGRLPHAAPAQPGSPAKGSATIPNGVYSVTNTPAGLGRRQRHQRSRLQRARHHVTDHHAQTAAGIRRRSRTTPTRARSAAPTPCTATRSCSSCSRPECTARTASRRPRRCAGATSTACCASRS